MGMGISYFASTAQYAERFSHTVTANSLKEMIIAKVVLGDIYTTVVLVGMKVLIAE